MNKLDKVTANEMFQKYIVGRWPDYSPSTILLGDWIELLQKFDEQDINKAGRHYVESYELFKTPKLNKFKTALSFVCNRNPKKNKDKTHPNELFPQYYIQYHGGDTRRIPGNFTQISFGSQGRAVSADDIGETLAMKVAERERQKHCEMYGGEWRIIVCQNEQDVKQLCQVRHDMNFEYQQSKETKPKGDINVEGLT